MRPADWEQLNRVAQERVVQSSPQLAAAMQASDINQSQVIKMCLATAMLRLHAPANVLAL